MLYCKFCDMETLKQLYLAFVHPHLQYATVVWDHHLSKDIFVFSVLHEWSVSKHGMIPIVTCCMSTTYWYLHFLKGVNFLKCAFCTSCFGFVVFLNAPLMFKTCTDHFSRYSHPLTLVQPETCTNSSYFSMCCCNLE